MNNGSPSRSLLALLLLSVTLFPSAFNTYAGHNSTSQAYPDNGTLNSSFAPPLTDRSWNPAVSCTAVVTTIEQVLGNQYNSTTGGALFSGGGFRPGIPNKRSLNPPCSAGSPANATFVEFRNVTMAGSTMIMEDCSTNYAQVNGGGVFPNGPNCDLTRNLFDPLGPKISNVTCPRCMSGLFVEIDRDWNASGTAPPMIGVNGTRERIDVQGFLYWNHDELDEAWHLYSGWELHPLTAWRRSGATEPDYYLANRRLLTVQPGSSNSTALYLGSIFGFQGTVSLTASISPPGPMVTLSIPTVELDATGWETRAQLVLTVSAQTAAPGAYLVTVTGTSGTMIHKSLLTVIVTKRDFAISASPDSLALEAGTASNSTITITSIDNFTGNLVLTTAALRGFAFSFDSSAVSLAAGGQANSTLTMNIAYDADPGIYAIAITGTDGTLSHSAVILVEVFTPPPPQGFDISATPGSVSLIKDQTGSTNITLTSINAFAGNVTLAESISPDNGLSCSMSPVEVILASSADAVLSCSGVPGAYNVLVLATSSNLSRTVNVGFTVSEPLTLSSTPETVIVDAGNTGSSIITGDNFAGTLSLRVLWTSKPDLSCSLDSDILTGRDDAALLSCSGSAGNYSVTVTGTTGTQSATTEVAYVVSDFSLDVVPAGLTVNPGSTGSATATLESLNGFSGTVILDETVSPKSGLNCSLTPASVNLDTSARSVLQCAGSPGLYSATITATSSDLLRRARLNVTVTDFALYPTLLSLTVRAGEVGSSTVRVAGLQGFEGEVSFSTNSSTFGLNMTVDPNSVTISGPESASVIIRVSTSASLRPSSYLLVAVAKDGPVSHSLNVTVNVLAPLPRGDPMALGVGLLVSSLVVLAITTVTFPPLFRRRDPESQQDDSLPREDDYSS